jgi:hypothetical protein
MASVFKPTVTKPLPTGAELFTRKGEQFARWKDAKGRTRTEPVTIPAKGKHAGTPRIIFDSTTYIAKYRDGAGLVRKVSTGCHDETAARSVLQELVNRAERVKANVLTVVEDAISGHQDTSLPEHFTAYIAHLEAKGTTAEHRGNVRRCLDRLAKNCDWTRLNALCRDKLEQWLVERANDKGPDGKKLAMSARTRNTYHAAIVAFANWCLRSKRLAVNPFAGMSKADENADRRRQRRALTEAELVKLLETARRRPLLSRAAESFMRLFSGYRRGRT